MCWYCVGFQLSPAHPEGWNQSVLCIMQLWEMLTDGICHLSLGAEMALVWSDRVLSATALSEIGQWARCLGSEEQQLGSSTWSCAQEQGFQEVPFELIHQPWASPAVFSTCTGQESVYCVDGNVCKGGVCYVVDVLICSWETVLRSWCICFIYMGSGDLYACPHIWVTSTLPAEPSLHLSSCLCNNRTWLLCSISS